MVGTWTSRTVLKIRCKFFSLYLMIARAVAGTLRMENFTSWNLAGWSNNLSSDLGDGEKLKRVTKEHF